MKNRLKPQDSHIKLDFVVPAENSEEKKLVLERLKSLWQAIEALEKWKEKRKGGKS